MKALLGIDLGTTGIRATLLGTAGEVLTRCSRGYGACRSWLDPAAGEAQAKASIFRAAVSSVIGEVLEAARLGPSAVQALALSAMAPDAVAVDADSEALMPCILWMDRRAAAEAEEVRTRIGEKRVRRLSGNSIDPYYGLIKALWIRNHLPGVYRRAAKILSLKDYLLGRYTGRLLTDVSHAGLYGIAYDIRNNRWDGEVLRELGLDPDKLPDALPGDEIAGTLTSAAASELGLEAGTPVAAGGIDSAAGYLACGCLEAGQSAMALGSSSCWGICTDTAHWPTGMNITRAPWNPGGYLVNASLAAGGMVLAWLLKLFRSDGQAAAGDAAQDTGRLDSLEAQAAAVPIGSGGLFTLPHFLGERAPLWDPDARGVLFGLHPGHGPAHLYRSAMEGIALSFYRNELLLRGAGVEMDGRIRVTGGWGASRLLRRILADVLNRTLDYVGNERSSDFGAAWLAGKAAGVFPDYAALREPGCITETVEPSAPAHRRYAELYDRIYSDLYPGIRAMYPRLGDLPPAAYE